MSDVIERKVVKEESHVITYSDSTILVKEVRLSYPHFDKPWALGGDKPKYSMTGLMPKTPAYAKSKALLDAVIQKVAADKQSPSLPASQRFVRDGDETDKRSSSAPPDTVLLAKGTNPDNGGAEVVYHENASGGAVFSAGSITWIPALFPDAHVSQITRNVLWRFLAETHQT